MKWLRARWIAVAAALAVVVVLVGGLVVASGIVPVRASSKHWAITAWLLHFAMKRSVATHSLGVHLPDLDQPWLVLQGAGHYEGGCKPCHGGPGGPTPAIAAAMTPHPPLLSPIVGEWQPEELFYVVRHGVKFTGMPAWPSRHRDDEVEAMVAFLLELPHLDEESYRDLVFGDEASVPSSTPPGHHDGAPAAVASCGRCHGADGNGRGLGAFPKLAGQTRRYLVAALDAYADGRRHSGTMEPIARAMSREARREAARHYSSLPRVARAGEPADDAANLRRGERIAARGLPRRGVPSCVDCHGPAPQPRRKAYPLLASQYARYLALQLELFRDDRRGGSPFAPIMRHVATRLDPKLIRDVAAWYASMPAPGENGGLHRVRRGQTPSD